MTLLTDLLCPHCGAPMDLLTGGKTPVCRYCAVPVAPEPGSPEARLSRYREQWLRLEKEYRQVRQAYQEEKCRLSGKKLQSPRSTPYLNEQQTKQLEPYTAELISKLVGLGERSNNLAARVDVALKSRAALEASPRWDGFPDWPGMFANILELEPHGPDYLDRFEPLMYELSRRDLLAPRLGRIITSLPILMLVRSIPVMITRNLEFGWAMEIDRSLRQAGALTRIACTELAQDLAMEMRLPGE